MLDRIVIATYDGSGVPVDHISINLNLSWKIITNEVNINVEMLRVLEEEFRSIILKLLYIDAKLPKFPEGKSLKLIRFQINVVHQ